jgi:hypothetical protein
MNKYNKYSKEQLVNMLSEVESILENSYNESEARSKEAYNDISMQLAFEAGCYRGSMKYILDSLK